MKRLPTALSIPIIIIFSFLLSVGIGFMVYRAVVINKQLAAVPEVTPSPTPAVAAVITKATPSPLSVTPTPRPTTPTPSSKPIVTQNYSPLPVNITSPTGPTINMFLVACVALLVGTLGLHFQFKSL